MRTLQLVLLVTPVALSGCLPEIPLRPDDPMTAEVAGDYEDVMSMRQEPEPEPPPLHLRAANYAYQGMVRYPASYIPTVVLSIPAALLGEVLVAGLAPTVSWAGRLGPQDWVDDAVYYSYMKGVNLRRVWNETPRFLGIEEDLVERDRRGGLPETTRVPAEDYPRVDDLVPPKWDEPPRSSSGGGAGPDGE